MTISQFKAEHKEVFKRAFIRALGGSVSLYSDKIQPSPVRVDIKPIRAPINDALDALKSDWNAVGADIFIAIRKHGKQIT